MILTHLEQLKDFLETTLPLFAGNGYINIKGREQEVKGIEDTIENYFLLDFQDDSRHYSLNAGSVNQCQYSSRLQILIKTTNKDLCSVSKAFISRLNELKTVIDISGTSDNLTISRTYGLDSECCMDLQLLKFTFSFTENLLGACNIIECKETSC